MTVKQLKEKLKRVPETSQIVFDDLQGGRIPVEEFRVESSKHSANLGGHSKPALVVLSDGPAIDS